MLTLLLLCVLGGFFLGLLNGMLGVGGAFITIPLLDTIIPRMGVPAQTAHLLALGTAPATIMFTCIASFIAHRRLGTVRPGLLIKFAPGIILGSIGGAFLAPFAPTVILKGLFALLLVNMSLNMLKPPRQLPPSEERLGGLFGAGLFFGSLASLSGVAGTMLALTYLNCRGVAWRQAVGTCAGVGVIISLSSATSYILSGLSAQGLPEWSIGYLYLPGLLCLVLPSMFSARLGAWIISRKTFPIIALKRCVAIAGVFIAAYVIQQTIQQW